MDVIAVVSAFGLIGLAVFLVLALILAPLQDKDEHGDDLTWCEHGYIVRRCPDGCGDAW